MAAEAFDATCASLTTGVVAPGRKSLPPVRLRQPIAAAVSPARPLVCLPLQAPALDGGADFDRLTSCQIPKVDAVVYRRHVDDGQHHPSPPMRYRRVSCNTRSSTERKRSSGAITIVQTWGYVPLQP
eukprot:scaffold1146_cov399-Prasinococcus_capsulatus_cf.AAC.3